MATTFKRNGPGMSAITRNMGAEVSVQAARRGLAWAQMNAPVRTGEYKSKLKVEPATVTVKGRERKGARIVAEADHSFGVEWGRGAVHLLGRAVDYIEKGA